MDEWIRAKKVNCEAFLKWAKEISKQENDMLRPEMWVALANIWSNTK